MRGLARAFGITSTAGFLIGALLSCGRWSPVYPHLSLAAAVRAGMIGWVVGTALAPLASRRRWRVAAGELPPPRGWVRAAAGAGILVALLPAVLWVAAASPGGPVRRALFGGERPGDKRPNLIFITIDALRRDHLGCYGSRAGLTPNLDGFAEQATRYEAAYANSPWTLTSFAGMFTSLAPSECGLKTPAAENQAWYERSAVWPDDIRLLPERLHQAGYATAAVITNPFLQAGRGCSRGFETFRNENVEAKFAKGAARANVVTRNSVGWLRLNRRQPFFLWVHYLDPHSPYDAPTTPPEIRAEYPPQWDTTRNYWAEAVQRQDAQTRRRYQEFCRRMYAEEVRYADQWLGKLLSAIKASGLYEDSLIVITADHGEELFDHGGIDHGHTMYSEVLSVPLLVKWPQGTRADARIRQTVCLTNLTPTFLELAGVRDRQGVRGRPLPRQDGGPGDQVYAEGLLYGKEQTAFVTDQFKVVYHPFADAHEEQFEVYDLQRDPAERHNLAATDATAPLRQQLAKRSHQAHALAQQWQQKLAAGSSRFRLSEDAKRSLRSLGYMGK